MSDAFAFPLFALDQIDEPAPEALDGRPPDRRDASPGVFAVLNIRIAEGLGLRVEVPSNKPYISVTSDFDADPYARPDLFTEMPDYCGCLGDAVKVGPEGHDLVLLQVGASWRAAYKPGDAAEPEAGAWKESASPARAVTRAALYTRVRACRAAPPPHP